MPNYRVNYGFEIATDDEEKRFGQGIIYVQTDEPLTTEAQQKEVLRTIGLNNDYIKVGLQQILEVDEDEFEIVGDNNDRFEAN